MNQQEALEYADSRVRSLSVRHTEPLKADELKVVIAEAAQWGSALTAARAAVGQPEVEATTVPDTTRAKALRMLRETESNIDAIETEAARLRLALSDLEKQQTRLEARVVVLKEVLSHDDPFEPDVT